MCWLFRAQSSSNHRSPCNYQFIAGNHRHIHRRRRSATLRTLCDCLQLILPSKNLQKHILRISGTSNFLSSPSKTMKKISFSVSSNQSSSKSIPKSKHDSAPKPQINRESISEFDPSSRTQTLENAPKKIVIPPKQNEWRPLKRMKNLDLPPIHSEGKPLEFEVEDEADVVAPEAESKISYGLNLRQDSVNGKGEFDAPNSIDAIMLKKLKSDLDKLPEDEGFDQFDEVPVEGFGEALLAGYGWRQGMGIGRNAKEDVKVVEYKRRTAKEGLGFTDDNVVPGSNNKNKGSFEVGKEVRIIGGRNKGYKGKVIEVLPGGDSLFLRISRSEEKVKVGVNEVAEWGSLEEDKRLKELKELKIKGSKESSRGSDKKGGKDSTSEGKESKRGRNEGRRGDAGEVKHEHRVRVEEKRTSSGGVSWLRSHIRVRIVSKSFKEGKFYLKKGVIIDVVGARTCDISMDGGREIVQGVEQDILETALPKRGGPVLVLFGKHKGTYGSLVEKDSKREAGVVQDADSRELIHVLLEQVAEFVGDPSDIGY